MPSLEDGRCCHESVPLRARPVAVDNGRDGSSVEAGEGKAREVAVSRSLVGEDLPVTALDLERVCVGECDWRCEEGLNSTGGLIARSVVDFDEKGVAEKTLAGPVLEGEIDRALSVVSYAWSVH